MFTSAFIKDVSKILSERSLKNNIAFICLAANESEADRDVLPSQKHKHFESFGLHNFSGGAFGQAENHSMLRRFMFLDFIMLYLLDEENKGK